MSFSEQGTQYQTFDLGPTLNLYRVSKVHPMNRGTPFGVVFQDPSGACGCQMTLTGDEESGTAIMDSCVNQTTHPDCAGDWDQLTPGTYTNDGTTLIFSNTNGLSYE